MDLVIVLANKDQIKLTIIMLEHVYIYRAGFFSASVIGAGLIRLVSTTILAAYVILWQGPKTTPSIPQ